MLTRLVSFTTLIFLVGTGCSDPANHAITPAIGGSASTQGQPRMALHMSQTYLTDETRLEVSVDRDSALSAPRWNLVDANPPLPAAEALRLANDALAKLTVPGISNPWNLDHIELRELAIPRKNEESCWCWTMVYHQPANEHEPIPQLEIRVLMDGKVFTPSVIEAPIHLEY